MGMDPSKSYRTLVGINGPLIVLDNVTVFNLFNKFPKFAEIVNIQQHDGTIRKGQVLEVQGRKAIVQVFEGTAGLDSKSSVVKFSGSTFKFGVGEDCLGRMVLFYFS